MRRPFKSYIRQVKLSNQTDREICRYHAMKKGNSIYAKKICLLEKSISITKLCPHPFPLHPRSVRPTYFASRGPIVFLIKQSRKPRKDTYPLGMSKGYPRDRGRVMELLIGGEFLSYPSLIGQLTKGYPIRHP